MARSDQWRGVSIPTWACPSSHVTSRLQRFMRIADDLFCRLGRVSGKTCFRRTLPRWITRQTPADGEGVKARAIPQGRSCAHLQSPFSFARPTGCATRWGSAVTGRERIPHRCPPVDRSRVSAHLPPTGKRMERASGAPPARCTSRGPDQSKVSFCQTVSASWKTCSKEGRRWPTTLGRPLVCWVRSGGGSWSTASNRPVVIKVTC